MLVMSQLWFTMRVSKGSRALGLDIDAQNLSCVELHACSHNNYS